MHAIEEFFLAMSHSFEAPEAVRKQLYTWYAHLFQKGETVLDLGCGTGVFLEVLKERGIKGIGVEYDPSLVSEATRKGLTVIEMDLLNIRDDFFGQLSDDICISMIHIIEHFHPKEILPVMFRLCTQHHPKKMLIVTPNFENTFVNSVNFWLDVTHVRPYPPQLLTKIAQLLGFLYIQQGTANNGLDVFIYAFKNPSDAISTAS